VFGVGASPLKEIDTALLRKVALEELLRHVFSKGRSLAPALWDGELTRVLETCFSIVRSERKSSIAIWRLVGPRATKAATSRSLAVRGSVVRGSSYRIS
jgi:hypothetical protein